MTEKKNLHLRYGVITLMVLLAAFSRLLPHPPNFAPIGAMALFGAAYFSQRYLSFLIPIISMWLSDLVLNNVVYSQYFDHFVWFYQGCYWTYGAFIMIGLIGFVALKRIKIRNLILASLLASIIFFLLSNFGVWASTNMYPKSFSGLMTCYAAGLPFFKNTLLGDFVYIGVLFGAFEFAQSRMPVLRLESIKY
ncbi:MAG TPA: hypothetical protein PK252_04400 [Bacteroidales bacterium]|nr:hypothetical protein [Bacteroidales bacterium]